MRSRDLFQRVGWRLAVAVSLQGLVAALACGGRAERLEQDAESRPAPDGVIGPLPITPEAPMPTAPQPDAPQPDAPQPDAPQPDAPPAMPEPQAPDLEEPPAPVELPEPPVSVTMDCGDPSSARMIAYEQSELDSLAGCEELTGLRVYGALDLRPLGSLRRVVGEAGVELLENTSLEGLEGLEEAIRLEVSGGAVPDLRPLAGLRRIESLKLTNTRLVDLVGLENLEGLRLLDVQDNPVLQSLQGLAVEGEMADVTFERNPALRDISSLATIEGASFVLIRHNPALAQLPNFERLVRLDGMLLSGNATLQAAPQFPLLTSTKDISIVDHPMLQRVTGLAALETARYLWISGNDNLVELDLAQLRQAETLLVIVDNPQLDGAALASALAGVATELHRVPLDQSRAVQDPCPWVTDDVCDTVFCAPGTDPACLEQGL